jgi:hypothetical protein
MFKKRKKAPEKKNHINQNFEYTHTHIYISDSARFEELDLIEHTHTKKRTLTNGKQIN